MLSLEISCMLLSILIQRLYKFVSDRFTWDDFLVRVSTLHCLSILHSLSKNINDLSYERLGCIKLSNNN